MRIRTTDEFAIWFDGLNKGEQKAVAKKVEMLNAEGTNLGFPASSVITHKENDFGLRELRIGKNTIRVFYAFDDQSDAWLLIGGSKQGAKAKRFYDRMVKEARDLFEEYTNG